MLLMEKKGKRILLLKELYMENGLKENASLSKHFWEKCWAQKCKNLLCSLDCHYRHSDIKGKAEFLWVALAGNTHAMLLNAESTCEVPGTWAAARILSGLLSCLGRVLACDVAHYMPLLQNIPSSIQWFVNSIFHCYLFHISLLRLYFSYPGLHP